MKRVYITIVAAGLLLGIAALACADDLGSVEIPTSVKLKGAAIPAGTYTFALERQGEELMLLLKQGGQVVASEIAITKAAKAEHKRARLAFQTLKRDKNDPVYGRIFCSYQGKLYLLYFEK